MRSKYGPERFNFYIIIFRQLIIRRSCSYTSNKKTFAISKTLARYNNFCLDHQNNYV